MSNMEIIMAILAGGSLLTAVISILRTSMRDGNKDAAASAQQDEQVKSDVRYLVGKVDEISYEIRRQSDKLSDVDKRLVIVEQSAKSFHKRMDEHVKTMHPPDIEHEGR